MRRDIILFLVARGADPQHLAAPIQQKPLDVLEPFSAAIWPKPYFEDLYSESPSGLVLPVAAGLAANSSFRTPNLPDLVAGARGLLARNVMVEWSDSTVPELRVDESYGRTALFQDPVHVGDLAVWGLAGAIRCKPEWRTKMFDVDIVQRWFDEAEFESPNVFKELAFPCAYNWLASERAARDYVGDVHSTGPAPYTAVLFDFKLGAEFSAAIGVLERSEPDWHPYPSDPGRRDVRDLVHPSLYPLIAGQSVLKDGTVWTPKEPAVPFVGRVRRALGSGRQPVLGRSARFQWLPADVRVTEGKAEFVSYINNLPATPETAPLHAALTRLVEASLPMWEEILGDLHHSPQSFAKLPLRPGIDMSTRLARYADEAWTEHCDDFGSEDGQTFERFGRVWTFPPPTVREFLAIRYRDDVPFRLNPRACLHDRTLQVIVKLANIELTPSRPRFAGGSWHLEGMDNERIVAASIMYYDVANITESRLAFQSACSDPPYSQDDWDYCERFYGLRNGEPLVQPLQPAVVRQGMILAWSNQLQHRVEPFELADPSRPGHRKVAVLFLVHPDHRIISSADVPAQQPACRAADLASSLPLPAELIHHIVTFNTLSIDEAKNIRLKLMAERTSATEIVNSYYESQFSLCEH